MRIAGYFASEKSPRCSSFLTSKDCPNLLGRRYFRKSWLLPAAVQVRICESFDAAFLGLEMQLQADRRLPSMIPMAIVWASLTIPWAPISASGADGSLPAVKVVDPGNPLLLPQDRQQEQWLASARKSILEKDFGQAVVVLRRVLAMDDDSYIANTDNSTVLSARQQALMLVETLPDEVRSRFEADVNRDALDQWLTTKQTPTIEALSTFLNRFRGTPQGLEALRLTAATYRDAGHHALAATAWQSVMRHPLATAQQQTHATLALFDALVSAGELSSAERVLAELKLRPVVAVQVAGQPVNPVDWMQRRLRDAGAKPAPIPNASSSNPQLLATTPLWTRSLGTVPELQKATALVQRYYREQGVTSSPLARPLILGNIVLTRTIRELMACDLKTGDQLWSIPNQEYSWLAKASSFLEASPFRTANASAWNRRSEVDSVFASIGAHGNLVVVVQEPDRSATEFSMVNAQPRQVANGSVSHNRWNKLCGYDLNTRQLMWQMGGPPTGPADVFGGITFLGVPLFVDNLLFVVARRDDELVLLAMDHTTGHLRWSVSLGVLAPHLADNVLRRRVACPVVLSDGLLLCPTASGMVVAVNPLTRTIEWAYRYPMLQHDSPVRPPSAVPTAVLPDAWWNEWREIGLIQIPASSDAPGVILLSSPDTGHLHAINARTGVELWTVPRGSGLHLAGVSEGIVVVVESMAVRGHDVQSGRLQWRAEIGEISGRGAISGSYLLQPRRGGGIAAINVVNGTQIPGLAESSVAYQSLVPCEGGWVAQSEEDLSRLPLLETIRLAAEERWKAEPSRLTSLELARLDLQSGQPIKARERLEADDSPEAKSIRHAATLTILRQPLDSPLRQNLAPQPDQSRLEDELLGLCEDDGQRLIALRAIADNAYASGDLTRALSLYLDGLQLTESIGLRFAGYWAADSTSTRLVRADRVLLGAIQRLLEDARRLNKIDELERLLNDRLESAARDSDPFAMQRLLDRLHPLEWARSAILSHETSALYARPPQKADPMILSIVGSPVRQTSALAFELFAKLQSRAGARHDSETIQRRLLATYPGTPLSNGEPLAVTLASQPELAEARTRILCPVADPWPSRSPTVERETGRHEDVYLVPVPVQNSIGSLLHQLDVSIERTGRSVRFACAGYSGTWSKVLPGAPKVLRSGFANHDQAEAYAIGRLLVLRVGSEIFGVLPFNERGEPRAELTDLRLDIAPDISNLPSEAGWYLEPLPARLGIRHEGSRLVDPFGRTFSGLSVVRASYICYRSQAKLIAIDTQSGKRLWERLNLPVNCQISGDEDCVYLWNTDEHTMQTLSAIDGHAIDVAPWDHSPDNVVMHEGGRFWTVARGASTTVSLTYAHDGAVAWSRTFNADAIPFAMDQTTLGIVERTGVLHLLAAQTGATLGEPLTVDCPPRVERIVCLHDAQRWYVGISAPVARLPNLQADQLWGGSRVHFVNGWLYGIDRDSASISWRRHLDSECLPRHASQVGPTIIQMWRRPASDASGETNVVGFMRVIDKRNGNELVTHRDTTLYAYSVLNPSANFETLDIFTERETFRLNFNSVKQDPMLERASEEK
eukprot:TRINITY_DN53_c0_g1_i2.p1 TRINITY_DN53_c0_g1~~TRINITY_DN53_c0_g1_i2.p1  ORF type:complete len:1572 (+),score=277.26 TRINITY_DN53_c0_g1_i2:2084-6799(+)